MLELVKERIKELEEKINSDDFIYVHQREWLQGLLDINYSMQRYLEKCGKQ